MSESIQERTLESIPLGERVIWGKLFSPEHYVSEPPKELKTSLRNAISIFSNEGALGGALPPLGAPPFYGFYNFPSAGPFRFFSTPLATKFTSHLRNGCVGDIEIESPVDKPMSISGNVPHPTGIVNKSYLATSVVAVNGKLPGQILPSVAQGISPDLATRQVAIGSDHEIAEFIYNEGIYFNTKGMPDEIKQTLGSSPYSISTTLASTYAFVDILSDSFKLKSGTKLIDALVDDRISYSAYEIQKVKGTFTQVQITGEKYKSNPQKYILCLMLPKVVELTYPASGGYARLIVRLPTYIISKKLLTSTVESVRATALRLCKVINTGNLQNLFRPSLEEAKQMYGDFTRYGDYNLEFFSSFDIGLKETLTQTQEAMIKTWGSKDINQLISLGWNVREARQLTTEMEKLTKIAAQLEISKTTSITVNRNIEQHNAEILRLASDLERTKQSVVGLINHKTTIDETLTKQAATVAEATNQLEEKKTLAVQAIKEACEANTKEYKHPIIFDEIHFASKTCTYFISFDSKIVITRKSGMRDTSEIGKLIMDINNGTKEEALSNLVILLAKSDIVINSIRLHTDTPVEIYVDSATKEKEKCSVVLAGPFAIDLFWDRHRSGTASVIPKDTSAILGVQEVAAGRYKVKVHPHANTIDVRTKDPHSMSHVYRVPAWICLGETVGPLTKAAERGDLESVKHLVYAWLTSAWSADEWGAQWHWFPQIPNPLGKSK